jgi:uroporphyrinogen-III synthase
MSDLKAARIALLEARMSSELSDLIRRHGGQPYSVPAVREAPLECGPQVSAFIDHLAQASLHTVVFLTGAGVNTLLQVAENAGRLPELLNGLRKVTVVCRGAKPSAALKRSGVPVALNAKEPYTTKELIEALQTLDLVGKDVALVHYGERNATLTQALHEMGAQLEELCLYEWQLPEETGPLETLIREIIARCVDAVIFTSQIQVRHLFLVAVNLNATDELRQALNTRTLVASIGPTCTAALEHLGVTPHVVPEHPKIGHLVRALGEHMEQDG